MRYISTRDKDISLSSGEAIIQGISKDGGLFVPERIPQIGNLSELAPMNYQELAFFILSKFFTDFDPLLLKGAIEMAYDEKFSQREIVSVEKVKDAYFLELYHGPTFAFKDMALSLLPYLLKIALDTNKIQKDVVILTATSGDTGKAALEGFANVEAVKIVVLFPEEGVSEIQKLQMKTQEGQNTLVLGIQGDFDDAQNGVKSLFGDKEWAENLAQHDYILSSANSINIGRLIPQIVYYLYGYFQLVNQGEIKEGENINIAVPTGNFGNILAAYYAKEMGLPIKRLLCASNANNVLADFFHTGTYDARRRLIPTSSPSMDILISSNLERLLFYGMGQDDQKIKQYMERLKQEGLYTIEDWKPEDFYGDYCLEKDVTKGIKEIYARHNYVMDPHTAVAYGVYQKYKADTKDSTKTLILSTASPFKFANKVADSLGMDTADKDEFQILMDLGEKADIPVPEGISSLKDKEIIHRISCAPDQVKSHIEDFLKVGERDV